jgi:phosphoesterase RecJ-like protein
MCFWREEIRGVFLENTNLFTLDCTMQTYSFPPLKALPAFPSGLDACIDIIARHTSFCITTHVNSDGDSLGSQLGLTLLLRQLGKTVQNVNPSHVPENLRFLPCSDEVLVFDAERDTSVLAEADVILVLDGNSPSRMRGMEEAIMRSPAVKAVIDHHQEPVEFARAYAIDTEACSTAELIYRLLTRLEERDGKTYLTKPLAEALYTGIMTDTGNFRFPRTTSDVHRIIARCIDVGVEPYYIFDSVFNQNPMNRSRLLGLTLANLQTYHNGKLCMMLVSEAMMRETETNVDHLEGFVEQTLGLRGVQMGAIVAEMPDEIKISLRSKGSLPVNKIAGFFGGGGHINAAGCRTKTMSFREVQETIVRLSAEYLA